MIPLVSIVIPIYNRAHLIVETLDSVLAQTYAKWECIVVDDGSNDNTFAVVNEYALKDNRIVFIKRPLLITSGGCGARNYGVSIAKGQYVIFLDSDDLLIPECLKNRIESLNSNNCEMLICHTGIFTNNIGDSDLVWNKLNSNDTTIKLMNRFFNRDMPWSTTSVTWDIKFLKKINGWNENLFAWQDWELHCRALFYKPKLKMIIEQPDSYWRRGEYSSIGSDYKSKSYILSLYKTVLSIDNQIKHSKLNKKDIIVAWKKFVYAKSIKTSIKNKFMFFPLKFIFKKNFIVGVNRLIFVKIYVIEFFCKSYRIRKLFFRDVYLEQQKLYKGVSSHLRCKMEDLFFSKML